MKTWLFLSAVACGCAHAPRGPVTTVAFAPSESVEVPCAPTGLCEVTGNGSTLLEGRLEEGKPVGSWRIYHPSGEVREEGNYVDGLRQGVWKYSGVSMVRAGGRATLRSAPSKVGEAHAHGEFVDGLMSGTWVFTHADKTVTLTLAGTSLGDDTPPNTLHGPYKLTTSDGNVLAEGAFERGNEVGEWREWYPTGELRLIEFRPDGPFVKLHQNGAKSEMGPNRSRVSHLEWHEHLPLIRDHKEKEPSWRYATKENLYGDPLNDLGQPCPDGTVIAGAVDGSRVEQWCQRGAAGRAGESTDTAKRSIRPEMFTSCAQCRPVVTTSTLAPKNGPFRSWLLDAEVLVEDGAFVDGERDGVWRVFDNEGAETVTRYKSGSKHGRYEVRRANGKLEVLGEFAKDQKHGEWVYFNANGQRERVEQWQNGKLR